MENNDRFLVLSLGLLLLSCYVTSVVNIYGHNPHEDVAKKLLDLQAQKQQLETKLTNNPSVVSKWNLQLELENVNRWIQHFETTSKVSLKDYLQTLSEQNEKHETEKERLRKKVEQAELMRLQAAEAFSKTKQYDRDNINLYGNKLKELTTERDKIAEEYAKLTQSHHQEKQTMNTQQVKLTKEREEMKRKLEKAQDLHSRALEAMAVAFQEGYKPVSIPYENEIKELKNQIQVEITETTDEMQLISELLSTQTKLEELLEKLYQESQVSSEAEHKDIESELEKVERDAIRARDHHVNRRKDIFQNIKGKALTGNDEKHITSLENANQQVANIDKALQEVARRNAYLKAISEVKNLIEDCKSKVQNTIARRDSAKKASHLRTLVTPPNKEGLENGEDTGLTSSKTIADVIYQKVSLYKDLHEFYRTKLSTEIVAGLAKVNKRIPIPFPGCKINGLIEIRDEVGKWVDRVQYALRLTKQLNEGDNRSIIAKFFVKFLSIMKNAYKTLTRRKKEESNLEDDDEFTASVEDFGEQGAFDFEYNFKYIKNHFSTLAIDAKVRENKLRDFRYNLIFIRKAPEIIEENTLRVLKEIDESSKDEESLVEELREELKEVSIAEKRLRELHNSLIANIKSTLEKKDREYQEVLGEYMRCRGSIFQGLPLFKYLS